jgi:iron(III) transport system substrate-binding protein
MGRTVSLVVMVALLAAACSSSKKSASSTSSSAAGSSSATAAAESASAACSAATNEDGGKLNYWAATDPAVFAEEIKPFEAEHPNIHISYTSLRPPDISQRLVAEAQAHHSPSADAVSGDLASLEPVFNQKLVVPMDLTALGIPADRQINFLGTEVWRVYRDPQGIVYNTNLVKASDLPTTWKGLIDSKWAGQVIVDPSADYVDNLALGYGEADAVTWLQNLLSTVKPVLLPGATASITKVVSGENKITTSATYSAYGAQKAKGAPIGIAFLDYVPTFDYYDIAIQGSSHVDAAKCFFSWLSGPEAGAQLLKYEYKQTATVPTNVPAGKKIVSILTADQANTVADTEAKMGKLMQN